MIDFSHIKLDSEYDRPTLAKMWGYKTFNAISRGVITPQGQNLVVLFVTKEKQETLTQYEDHIDQDVLFWEGEKAHGSDLRLISKKDFVHVFYRERHHSSFIYKGHAELKYFKINTDRPSKFSFQLIDKAVSEESIVQEVKQTYGLSETEKDAIIKSRRGQGPYRNESIKLWTNCCITGFTKKSVLIASHIKPWKVSSNEERLTAYNSLLLIPTLDKLFDKGYISFESNGKVMLSDKIQRSDWLKIGIDSKIKLRNIPNEIKPYLNYHGEYIFDLVGK